MRLDDTIVAISSPPGAAARGIVRLSGVQTTEIAATLFLPGSPDRPPGDGIAQVAPGGAEWPPGPRAAAVDGAVRIDGTTLPATAWAFRRPHSYTRQDLIELHLLGAPGVLGLLVERLIAAGARRAEPGEFTARAFLNGALDLGQVHGVAAMIAAQSDGQLRAARRLLQGALSTTATAAREELADLLSLVEGALDFADEPIEFITPVELKRRLDRLATSLKSTRDAGLRAERWGGLPRVLLAGAPNAGKSSLLNRLTGVDRAIATPVAGTTRDVLSAPIALGDRECLLLDVAGLDESPDPLDRRAQSAARAAASDADVIAWLADASDPNLDPANEIARLTALRAAAPTARGLVLLNKIDRLDDDTRHAQIAAFTAAGGHPVIAISAATGAGCDGLRLALADLLSERHDDVDTAAVALLGEHHDALNRALSAVERAVQLAGRRADSLADADLVALELHAAADALGVLVGRDVPDDLLGRVFARFCVGK